MPKGKKKGKKGKGKGGAGGPKVKKAKKVTDGLSPSEMTRKQLLGFIKRMQGEIEKERVERNFFMLDREKVFCFWNLILEQITVEKEKGRLLDIHLGEADKAKKGELDFFKQKLRFLQAEQSKKLGLARLQHLLGMRKVQDDLWELQMILKEGVLDKRKQFRAAQMSLYDILRNMHVEHSEKVSKLRTEFEKELKRMEMEAERNISHDRDSTIGETKVQINQINAKKEQQLTRMLYAHEKQLLEMKTFFNDLTVNNMAVISSLQVEIENKILNQARLERSLKQSQDLYESLLIPVEEYEQQMAEWGDEAKAIQLVRKEFKKAEIQLIKNHRYTRMMECANEALLQKCQFIEKERDQLKGAFTFGIINMQKKASMSRMVQELKLEQIKRETNLATALANQHEFGERDNRDFIVELLKEEKDPLIDINQDISDGATEFRNTLGNMYESFKSASIHRDEMGFPILPTGAKARPREKKEHSGGSKSRHGKHSHAHGSKSLTSSSTTIRKSNNDLDTLQPKPDIMDMDFKDGDKTGKTKTRKVKGFLPPPKPKRESVKKQPPPPPIMEEEDEDEE